MTSCQFGKSCGGCQFQGVPYQEQLREKEAVLAALHGVPVPVEPHPSPVGYRIRMDFVCVPGAIGLRGADNAVVDVPSCMLQQPLMDRAYREIRAWVQEHEVPCVDPETGDGWLRYVTLRQGIVLQVVLTTTSDDQCVLVEELADRLPEVSLVWTVQAPRRDDSVGRTFRVLGPEHIPVLVGEQEFLIDAQSFFQASPSMLLRAVELMRPYVPEGASVLDLYCGVGTIGILLRPSRLIGVEQNASAVALARVNAQAHGLFAEFIEGSADDATVHGPFDVVVVDPPRPGLGRAVHSVLALRPNTVLYLSCNPRSQRRDLAALSREYEVVALHGLDFFPQTRHVECLAVLRRR